MKAVVSLKSIKSDGDGESKITLISPSQYLSEIIKLHLYEGKPFIMETRPLLMGENDGEV